MKRKEVWSMLGLMFWVAALSPPLGAQSPKSIVAPIEQTATNDQLQESTPSLPITHVGLSSADITALQEQARRENWTFTVGPNEATDYPLEQITGLIIPPDQEKNAQNVVTLEMPRTLPPAYDWRILRGTTPIRNQGGCGSCWAFSAVGPLESNILIKEGIPADLSEQWLVSCSGAGTCNGGYLEFAIYSFLCGYHGGVLESDFPYAALNLPCNHPYSAPYCIDSYSMVGNESLGSVPNIKQAIMTYGPVSVGVAADNVFQAYTGGIYNHNSSSLDHAVVLVGWDDHALDANGQEHGVWIMRNSWGPSWGENGYMRIQYGCSYVGNSAIAVGYNPPDCNHNGIPDTQDLAEGTSQDCNGNQLPDECERDCNNNEVPDDCDIAQGTSRDFNNNGLPDECETDCNHNGVFDFYDIQNNPSLDIDRNGIIDQCEDCNGNGVWDWEDLGRPGMFLAVSRNTNQIRLYHPSSGAVLGSFGTGYLNQPYDVVVDNNRHILVTSSGDNRVVEFDSNGQYLRDLSSCTDGPVYPTGLAIGPSGMLYVSGRANNSIFQYDLSSGSCQGEFISAGTGGLSQPYNLAWGPNGNLFVSSPSKVLEYNGQNGQFIRQYATGQYGALAFRHNGHLLATCYSAVKEFDITSGAYIGYFPVSSSNPLRMIQGMSWGIDGDLYISGLRYDINAYRVFRYDGETGLYERTAVRDPGMNVSGGITILPPSPDDCNRDFVPDSCIPFADCNGNGMRDECDIYDGTSSDCNHNGIPDSCDLADGTSQDCNGNEIPDECEPDCNNNDVPDSCDIADGTSQDCNHNGIPDECISLETDCNHNDVPDSCDIANGTSLDCNGNGIPEECEFSDCNGNGVADHCDIADGTSQDVNHNSIPDECVETHIPEDFPTIQAALDTSFENGATIWVAPGTYTGVGNKNLDFHGKALTLRCEEAGACTIDSQQRGRGFYFHSGETNASIVDGFTIINGRISDHGGGIYCDNSSPTIIRCIISGNSASRYSGGGIYCYGGSPAITRCTISGNSATSYDDGGGIYCDHSSPIITDCTIFGNTAYRGAGICCDYNSKPHITRCTISGNSAVTDGGGIYGYYSGWPTIGGCIFWGNAAPNGSQIYLYGSSSVSVSFSDVQGGWSGTGNINANPLFAADGYHLQRRSPCRDAGDPAFVPEAGETDIDGEMRVYGGRVDMGADEWQPMLIPPDELDPAPMYAGSIELTPDHHPLPLP